MSETPAPSVPTTPPKLTAAHQGNEDPDLCAICLDPLIPRGTRVPLLNPACCGHSLHFICYQACINTNASNCPSCREPFVAITRTKFVPTPAVATDAANITFTNRCDHPVTIYWIAFDGTETWYATLLEGEGYRQGTYVGHVWIAKQGEEEPTGLVVGFYVVAAGQDWEIKWK
ncbi:hypothetical protein BC830DRAFT_1173952 [Chytriomyces sp. MP71]|nr:hypothetical protein BC830DRAFT_1173952 [Chytriomyces sp. MP71]